MRMKKKGEKKELQSSPHSLVVELPLANVGHSGFLSFPLLSSNANAINVMQCAVALQMHNTRHHTPQRAWHARANPPCSVTRMARTP